MSGILSHPKRSKLEAFYGAYSQLLTQTPVPLKRRLSFERLRSTLNTSTFSSTFPDFAMELGERLASNRK